MDNSRAEAGSLPTTVTAALIADLKASGERQRQALALLYRSHAPRLMNTSYDVRNRCEGAS